MELPSCALSSVAETSGVTFQSLEYLAFLGAVWVVWLGLVRARAPRVAQVVLLGASYVLYATWSPRFLLVLLASSLFNDLWGRWLRRRPTGFVLWGGLAANIALLGTYKYAGWILYDLHRSSTLFSSLVVPVGLSFYTFQAISYLIDTYRHPEATGPSALEFFLYMAFWPTVISGPVCRCGEMVEQFRRAAVPAAEDVATGLSRIVQGLAMKVVLADTLGVALAAGFDPAGHLQTAHRWSGIDVWTVAIGYGFQLFFDFAGYSHLVIGSARLFGIRLRENFRAPYLSTTPTEFWTRWHMSLSFWIRDYVFFPLAVARREPWWRHLSLVVSMTLFGLWHGAGLQFIAWGAYHGVLLVGHRLIQPRGAPAARAPAAVVASWVVTFGLISLGWVLFTAGSLLSGLRILRAVISPAGYFHRALPASAYLTVLVLGAGYLSCVGVYDRLSRPRGAAGAPAAAVSAP